MVDAADLLHEGGSFGGVAAAQLWCDFILWEAILNANRQTTTIVELGTWQGGFSGYLAAQARARGLKFRTYDAAPPDRPVAGFVRQNVLIEPGPVVRYVQAHEPVALLVDNGNKPRELAIYAPKLRDPRSLLVVHDWLTEVEPDDVPGCLTPDYEDYCDSIGSMSRVFRPRACSGCGHVRAQHEGFAYPPSVVWDTPAAGSLTVCCAPDCGCPSWNYKEV